MKLAIVHDYLNQRGGAERCVLALHEIFPEAPIFTSFYFNNSTFKEFQAAKINTTFMQRLPFIDKYFRFYLPVYPKAFKGIDLGAYDIILSSSSAWAKSIKPTSGSLHICYCYTPMRFAWDFDTYINGFTQNRLVIKILRRYIEKLKIWDIESAKRVDHFIAISNTVAKRIKNIYRRDSTVIYPAVDTSKFELSKEPGEYFLVVSRLSSYKRIDLAIKSCNRLKLPLLIVGDGPQKSELKKMAGPTVKFLYSVSDTELAKIFSKCKALIFPGEEDFGIAPVEAMASGRPVIAYKAGGATETVIGGKTGIFFEEQAVDLLIEAIDRFNEQYFNPVEIQNHSKKFDSDIFKEKIKSFVCLKSGE